MRYNKDNRIVMTLDAGGTNFVFSAIQANKEVVSPITLPSNPDDLNSCLAAIVDGFTHIKNKLAEKPAAISFAFPGPADYPSGIIGDLPNLPAFRGGVALGPMLEEKFKLPVFINNDGDLYAYGEALAGYLPHVNSLLEQAGSKKRYKNLLGITLGTGFGAGIVRDDELFIGDNSAAGEIWLLRNKLNPKTNVEENACKRAIRRIYGEKTGIDISNVPSPKEIYEIGTGQKIGNIEAATSAFLQMAEVAGDAIANALTLIDGIAVIGGGIAGAHPLFLQALVNEMNSKYEHLNGFYFPRLVMRVFNLEENKDLKMFIKGKTKEIPIPGTNRKITYDSMKRIGVGISKIGTSKAIAIGAYAFALKSLDGS